MPVASAILTATYPKEYCIIDYRAWRALLWLQKNTAENVFKFDSYSDYANFLDKCKTYNRKKTYFSFRDTLETIGNKRNMTPRQVEMALWKFDQQKGKCSHNFGTLTKSNKVTVQEILNKK